MKRRALADFYGTCPVIHDAWKDSRQGTEILKEEIMITSVTEALEALADASGEAIVLVHDPKDGLAAVVRWGDDEKRMAFLGSDVLGLEDDEVALCLLVRAARYLAHEAEKNSNKHRAVRIRFVDGLIDTALDKVRQEVVEEEEEP